MTSLSLEPIYGSLLFAIAATLIVVFVITLTAPRAGTRQQQRILIGLRIAAALILLLVTFRPSVIQTDRQPAPATLIVALDTSESMTLTDGQGGDRWTTQLDVWKSLVDGAGTLDEKLDLQLVTYDSVATELAGPTRTSLDQRQPDGRLTDITAAIRSSLGIAGGNPIAGFVLAGDGSQTADTTDDNGGAQRSVQTLNSIGVPLWSIPIGLAGDSDSARDVAISGLPDSYQLFAGNQISIDFDIQLRGLASQDIPINLTWVASDQSRTEAASRSVRSEKALERIPVSIPLTAPPAGIYRLIAESPTQTGELVATNNKQIAFVEVTDGGGKILFVDGQSRWEKTFTCRTLRQFRDLELKDYWVPATTASNWPADFGNAFEPGQYDIYLLGDIDSAAFGPQQLDQLAEAVGAGAGLVMLGGFNNFAVGGYADSPLAKVLPVSLDPRLRRPINGASNGSPNTSDAQIPGPIRLQIATNHKIVDLGGTDSAATWKNLPVMNGATRFLGKKRTPGTLVLLENEAQEPMLVVGEYGRGRTAAVAFDSSYLWHLGGHQPSHARFWRQLMLWLLSRENSSDERIQIELDSRRFNQAEPPDFTASLRSTGDDAAIELVAEVISDDSEASSNNVPTSTVGDQSEVSVSGKLPTLTSGIYRLRIRPKNSVANIPPAEVAFQVVDQSRELAQPMADPAYLKQLADLTADHGGRSFRPDQVGDLIELLSKRRRTAEATIVDRHSLGDGPISGWLVFVLFAAALGTEWWLRRKWSLP